MLDLEPCWLMDERIVCFLSSISVLCYCCCLVSLYKPPLHLNEMIKRRLHDNDK